MSAPRGVVRERAHGQGAWWLNRNRPRRIGQKELGWRSPNGECQPSAAQGQLAWGNGANIVVRAKPALYAVGRSYAHHAATGRSTTHGPVYRAIELLSLSALGTRDNNSSRANISRGSCRE